jgi:hypothetical protein
MAEGGIWAGSQEGGEQISLSEERPLADGINTSVERDQDSASNQPADFAVGEADLKATAQAK